MYCPAREHDYPYYCDDCVIGENAIPCSCEWRCIIMEDDFDNPVGVEGVDWKYIDIDMARLLGHDIPEEMRGLYWYRLQPNGKPWPCCEYDKDENGYDL